ncbi:MAG: hypothetical protein KAS32_09925, partial [Candidatus Peribacteraceae bacterium]|nr:hypothetical protein [Candidatus Peribacteraceae bacterium]
TINTIYHAFAVKYSSEVENVLFDTDVNGAGLPGTVDYKRWLGFVRTNGTGEIIEFVMSADYIQFVKPAVEFWIGSVVTSLAPSYTSYDISALLPSTRIDLMTLGCDPLGTTGMSLSLDGTNAVSGTYGADPSGVIVNDPVPYQDIVYLGRTSTANVNPLMCALKLRR